VELVSPTLTRIYSENNDFQYVDTLRRRREKRHKQREFFVEGVRPINQALAYDWTINAFLYARDSSLSDWARDILARSRARTHYELPLPLLQKLSNKAEPSELVALVAMPDDDLSRIPLTGDLCVVVFDRPASPGNLGTLIRSCDALGANGLVITGHAVDLYDPETISATTGSFFAVPTVRLPGPSDLLPWFETMRRTIGPFQIVGSSAKATVDLAEHDFTKPTVLLVGNETWGLSATFREMCDAMVTIPIDGSATSLNVACAASIILYEIDRQRRQR
jgi:TrmH family RNA methyltransferase